MITARIAVTTVTLSIASLTMAVLPSDALIASSVAPSVSASEITTAITAAPVPTNKINQINQIMVPVRTATPTSTLVAAPATETAETAIAASSVRRLSRRARIMRVARSLRGHPYVWGATGPWAFDCSGYVGYVYRHATGRHLPRTSWSMRYKLHRHSRHHARRGDILWMPGHVGIYAGRNRLWHAPRPGRSVRLERLWTRNWLILR